MSNRHQKLYTDKQLQDLFSSNSTLTEKQLNRAYHTYEARGDYGSANALRMMSREKYHNGVQDVGHANWERQDQ